MLVENVLPVDVPMISAVNGPCNIHSEVPLLGDIVLASEDAYFQDLAHFPRGMVPATASTSSLPAIVGRDRARYVLLTGKRLSAREALKWGAVTKCSPRTSFSTGRGSWLVSWPGALRSRSATRACC
jgi:enoyl-CoA hydratase/carnithine racemase